MQSMGAPQCARGRGLVADWRHVCACVRGMSVFKQASRNNDRLLDESTCTIAAQNALELFGELFVMAPQSPQSHAMEAKHD
jgi:hypothetical protein